MINNTNFLQTLVYQCNKTAQTGQFFPINVMTLIRQYAIVGQAVTNAAALVSFLDTFSIITSSATWTETQNNSLESLRQLPKNNIEMLLNEYNKHFPALISFLAVLEAGPNKFPPLLITTFGNRALVAKVLLAHPETDPNKADKHNNTPLHYAVVHEYLDIVQALLAHPKINPNLPDNDGETPLRHAAVNCRYSVIPALLAHKDTDIHIPDHYSKETALHYVERKNFVHAVNILQKHDFYSAAMKAEPTELSSLLSSHGKPSKDDIHEHLMRLVNALPDVNAKYAKLTNAIERKWDRTPANALSAFMHEWEFTTDTKPSLIRKAIDKLKVDTLPLRDVGTHTTRLYMPLTGRNQLPIHLPAMVMPKIERKL